MAKIERLISRIIEENIYSTYIVNYDKNRLTARFASNECRCDCLAVARRFKESSTFQQENKCVFRVGCNEQN